MRLRLIAFLGLTFGTASATAQPPAWSYPTLRGVRYHAMAYDSARQRVVLFGGRRHDDYQNETWELDGTAWAQRFPTTSPAKRASHAMAYDSARRRVVLFGGGTDLPEQADTWEWNGDTWTKRSPTTSPPMRMSHAMAYDSARQVVVLFGGTGLAATTYPLKDTWEWNGTSWTQRVTTTSPSARSEHAFAYDAARGRSVLFGGQGAGDTWEWDGTTWTLRQPAASPSPRAGAAMAYDGARQRIVLFGGILSGTTLASDTWEWDGSTWTQRFPPTAPLERGQFAMAYDSTRQRLVISGGLRLVGSPATLTLLSDTWEWDGSTWSALPTCPTGRRWPSMAYDGANQQLVVFGGYALSPTFAPLADTWTGDGRTWTRRSPATSPPARAQHAMAYDEARRRVLLFGGKPSSAPALGDTWEWDGTSWTQRVTVGPAARSAMAMCYDSVRQRVVLFGGSDGSTSFADTWEWDGSAWTQRTPVVSPTARLGHALAYDTARQRCVLHGGGGMTDTWEWDGAVWTQRMTVTSPPARSFAAMGYDGARGRVVLFGGLSVVTPLADLWEWNGSTWSSVAQPAGFLGLGEHAMAYDAARKRLVIANGLLGGVPADAPAEVRFYGLASRGSIQSIGGACPGTNGLPVLTANTPYLGNPGFRLELLNAKESAACVFGLAAATQSLALGGGCTLYVADPILTIFGTTSAAGVATLSLAVPFDPGLRGGTLYAQAAFVDLASPAFGLAFTAGCAVVLGD